MYFGLVVGFWCVVVWLGCGIFWLGLGCGVLFVWLLLLCGLGVCRYCLVCWFCWVWLVVYLGFV